MANEKLESATILTNKEGRHDDHHDEANKVLADLERKRAKAVEHWEALTAERSAISFAALAENDKDAKKRLDQIAADAFKVNGELEAIDAALRVAKERVITARAHEQRAEHDKLATEAEVNYKWLVEHGPQLSEHALAIAALLAEAKRRIDANHTLRAWRSPQQCSLSAR